ncbi:hypothetical protein WMY93_014396 [Mugilogobius chulae]|uniref:La-related protein 7 n=1 Tax=Mugilogobius chulae TaxID=88201 RepID=A0AAW0P1F0_9GOBI
MVEVESSCLKTVQVLRVSLVDQLEARIESILETLVNHGVFSRDDREQVLCHLGPRARVRQVLDIVQCKGEEAAKILLSLNNSFHLEPQSRPDKGQTTDYNKTLLKHKDVLKRRSESMLYYNTRHGEKILFSEHYVNLLLVDGHQGLDIKRHEVLTFGHKRLSLQHKSAFDRKVAPKELLTSTGSRPVRKVLVTGVAGIGKTILVQKMLFDFGRQKEHLEFDFIIHMTFRDLNLIDKPTNLQDLILRKNRHLAKELDNILANDHKLLIILDGFDEFKHYQKCDVDSFVSEPNEDAEVVEIIGSLMQGELLPNASVLLTSRPTAINYIPVEFIDRFALISGFSLTEVQEYFSRYFQNKEVADQMFALVAANELMLTLCYIPAFCYIVCCILKDNKDLCGEGPKTMTDIYVQYLVAMLRSHTQTRAETFKNESKAQPLSDIVLKLGQLAFHKLMEHQTLFYSSDNDVKALEGCTLVSSFLDKTMSIEPGCVEEIYSFAHLTVQEFFAAIYCAVTEEPLPEAMQNPSTGEGANTGHLDLFSRFLSGVLSERNASLISRHVGLTCNKNKVDKYKQILIRNIKTLCENGGNILNNLHCLVEQQDPSFGFDVKPKTLRINVCDETLSEMDYNAIQYFLNLTSGPIAELDLTGTGLTSKGLTILYPHLMRCENLWLGDNNLDKGTVWIIADVLQKSDIIIDLGIGWSNIGDDELIILSNAIRENKQLKELWMEGNRVSQLGLQSLADLTPHPLRKIVAIWNNVEDIDSLDSTSMQKSIATNFSEDEMWEDTWGQWGEWVLKRCEDSTNDKLITVLHKVCNIPVHCLKDHTMIDTEKGTTSGDAAGSSGKSKDKEKKKRSRVKQLLTDVKKQVEFWFGDVNLHKDRFLRKLVDESGDGYVDLSILASFNRMKNLTTDTKLIARALKNSAVVEVNLEGNKVRRLYPIGDPPSDEDSRTVYVELLPRDVSHNWIERVFSKCGNVVYVSIPRYKSTGDSKGFAFVEFEKVEQAQKAIEMLDNPPEDAPRKPGIFPKTLCGKTIPLPAENPTKTEVPTAENPTMTGEEEKKKRKKKKRKSSASLQTSLTESNEQLMDAEPVEQKKSDPEPTAAQKTTAKEKKRRRSQTVDASEGEMPSKMRKTNENGSGECSKSDSQAKTDKKERVKDEKENMDDSAAKAKRKRKKMHKEKLKIGEEVIPLRVLPKKAWLELKAEYLILQKHSMAALKKCITKIDLKEEKSQKDTENEQKEMGENVKMEEGNEKTTRQAPQFVSGVILKITDNKPLPGRKTVKEILCKISPVAYIDFTDGDAECHVRFYTPEQAKAVSDAKTELHKEHNWKIEILSGDHEQRYWQKILVDRQVKLNRPREKRRGTEKLISKAEKIIMARAKEANKHIRFDD